MFSFFAQSSFFFRFLLSHYQLEFAKELEQIRIREEKAAEEAKAKKAAYDEEAGTTTRSEHLHFIRGFSL